MVVVDMNNASATNRNPKTQHGRTTTTRGAVFSFCLGFLLAAVVFLLPGRYNEKFVPAPSATSSTTTATTLLEKSLAGDDRATAADQQPNEDIPTFLSLGKNSGTDKVVGSTSLPACLNDEKKCLRPAAKNKLCKVYGHYYDQVYQKVLGPIQHERFQFLEIGFYNGRGFKAFQDFMPNADHHSIEISCLPEGPQSEGKWPAEWGNFAKKSPQYNQLLEDGKLHCNDASDFDQLESVYQQLTRQQQKESGALPLRVIVEDASHLSNHMAISVLYWFPRLEPGGFLIVEDIESQTPANEFRKQFLSNIIQDLHFCGIENDQESDFCFPTLAPLLQSVNCLFNVCVLERNDEPKVEYGPDLTMPPNDFYSGNLCFQRDILAANKD